MTLELLLDKVLIKPIKEKQEEAKDGLVLPDTTTTSDFLFGEIVTVSDGDPFSYGPEGAVHGPLPVDEGDKVYFIDTPRSKITIENEEYYLVGLERIVAKVK